MKKIKSILSTVLSVLLIFTLSACNVPKPSNSPRLKHPLFIEYDQAIVKEMKGCFDFLWDNTNIDKDSPGYGLILDNNDDNTGNPRNVRASIASVGFALAGIPIGVEKGWITYNQGYERVMGTLKTMEKLERVNGFWFHFIDWNTGLRSNFETTEASIIDSAIMIFGALIAGQYFGDETSLKAHQLYADINWKWYTAQNPSMNNSLQFRMGYRPNTVGFSGWWNRYSEQLMMYFLAAGAPNSDFRMGKELYDGFSREFYEGYPNKDSKPFYYNSFGKLFIHQYSHAFIDFRDIIDADGVDWFENSVRASKAAYQYAVDKKNETKNLHELSWGLTACSTMLGYSGLIGSEPRAITPNIGHKDYANYQIVKYTVAPSAALGSMPFTPDLSISALTYFQSLSSLNGKYGLFDAYDLDHDWYHNRYIGIDKGITLLMLSNFEDGLIWELSSQLSIVKEAIERLGFTYKTNL